MKNKLFIELNTLTSSLKSATSTINPFIQTSAYVQHEYEIIVHRQVERPQVVSSLHQMLQKITPLNFHCQQSSLQP